MNCCSKPLAFSRVHASLLSPGLDDLGSEGINYIGDFRYRS